MSKTTRRYGKSSPNPAEAGRRFRRNLYIRRTIGGLVIVGGLVGLAIGGYGEDERGYDPTYSVERSDPNPDPPVPRPRVGDGAQAPAPSGSTPAPSTERSPVSTPPPLPKLTKIICKEMLFVSRGVVIWSPAVDRITGKPGVFPLDERPILNELPEGPPQDPGQEGKDFYWATKTGQHIPAEKVSDHCMSVDLKIVMRPTVCIVDDKPICKPGSKATLVPENFDEQGAPPINRAAEAVLGNPNDFHQTYETRQVANMPIPGLTMPANG